MIGTFMLSKLVACMPYVTTKMRKLKHRKQKTQNLRIDFFSKKQSKYKVLFCSPPGENLHFRPYSQFVQVLFWSPPGENLFFSPCLLFHMCFLSFPWGTPHFTPLRTAPAQSWGQSRVQRSLWLTFHILLDLLHGGWHRARRAGTREKLEEFLPTGSLTKTSDCLHYVGWWRHHRIIVSIHIRPGCDK